MSSESEYGAAAGRHGRRRGRGADASNSQRVADSPSLATPRFVEEEVEGLSGQFAHATLDNIDTSGGSYAAHAEYGQSTLPASDETETGTGGYIEETRETIDTAVEEQGDEAAYEVGVSTYNEAGDDQNLDARADEQDSFQSAFSNPYDQGHASSSTDAYAFYPAETYGSDTYPYSYDQTYGQDYNQFTGQAALGPESHQYGTDPYSHGNIPQPYSSQLVSPSTSIAPQYYTSAQYTQGTVQGIDPNSHSTNAYFDGGSHMDYSQQATRAYSANIGPSFRVHHSRDFKPGRVLKIFWSEPKGGNAKPTNPTIYSTTKHDAYSTDRRFIIMRSRSGHSIAVAIFTYGGQACTKRGTHPLDHGQIYSSRHPPDLLPGERALGFPPARMIPCSNTDRLLPESRVNYRKLYTIEHNFSVSMVGDIVEEDFNVLLQNFNAD